VFIYCNYEIASMKVYVDFESVSSYFVVDRHILLIVALVELLGLQILLYCL
jgi:hypothetical protein